jgi:hypothetical protein
MHLGILMRWFPSENSMQSEVSFTTLFADFIQSLTYGHCWLEW